MKIRLCQIGLAVLLAGVGPPLAGGAALALAIGDLPAVGVPRADSPPLDGAAGDPALPMAVGDAAQEHLRMLHDRRIPERRTGLPDESRLGVDNLIGFMVDTDRFSGTGINVRFNLDRRQTLNWMRFWTDIAFDPETEQKFDYRAIAQAAYAPEIRYWLNGTRWASFDTVLPRQGAAVEGAATQADAGIITGAYAADGRNGFAAKKGPAGAPGKKNGPGKAKTLTEFVLSISYKIFRQPIVYVILLVFAGILFASTRRQANV